MFWKKMSTGPLPDEDIVWIGNEEAPAPELIEQWVRQLPVRNNGRLDRAKSCAVWREERHVIGWMTSYSQIETRFLKDRFSSAEKSFVTVALISPRLSKLDLRFRLSTASLAGYTEYGVSCIRTSENDFLCFE